MITIAYRTPLIVGTGPEISASSARQLAQADCDLFRQPRDARTFELDLRPWVETF